MFHCFIIILFFFCLIFYLIFYDFSIFCTTVLYNFSMKWFLCVVLYDYSILYTTEFLGLLNKNFTNKYKFTRFFKFQSRYCILCFEYCYCSSNWTIFEALISLFNYNSYCLLFNIFNSIWVLPLLLLLKILFSFTSYYLHFSLYIFCLFNLYLYQFSP